MRSITKQFYLLAMTCLLAATASHGQLKIGNNPTTINAASLLEMESTNKGLVLPRVSLAALATAAPLDASLLDGTLVYNTNASLPGGVGMYIWRSTPGSWQQLVVSGNASTTLNGAYNFGGAGAGRTITANTGAVKIDGSDGLLVTGSYNGGASIEASGAGTRMFFNPRKAAFRVGGADSTEWDDANVGQYSIAMGAGAKASAYFSTSIGASNLATGAYSIAMGRRSTASNNDAITLGYNNQATGAFSMAMGTSSTASGNNATTTGYNNQATGANSIAMGHTSIAGGQSAMASGHFVQAKSYGSATVGTYNNLDDNPNASIPAATDRIFQIGNGDQGVRRNAITVLRNGRTGLSTVAPAATLHVAGIDGLLVTGTYNSGASIEASGAGIRMFFNPRKAAFRAGGADSTEWDDANVGQYSIAMGAGARASAYFSTSIGAGNQATGAYSTSIGADNQATGAYSMAMGTSSTASGNNATTTGYNNQAAGSNSIAMGHTSIAGGQSAMASGHYVQAKSYGGATVGAYNNLDDNPNGSSPATTDRIFQVGNGTSITRSNAITVLRNGRTGIITLAPSATLHVAGTDGLLVTGTYNSGASIEASGAGTRMFFNPRKAAFRAGRADSTEWDDANVGQYSFAMGAGARASAYFSTSIGAGNQATGAYSMAMGRISTASGDNATTTGYNNQATGANSIAMGHTSIADGQSAMASGHYVQAKSYGGATVGAYNNLDDNPNGSSPAATDRIFQLGNGTASIRSNAITVLRNGRTGISALAPSATLHVAGIDGLLVTGTYNSGASIEASGAGTRMFFNPRKAAFRAGGTDSTEWDDANVGQYSIAMGAGARASAYFSTSIGAGNQATGAYSMAMGRISTASGNNATTTGYNNQATGANSIAMGHTSIAGGQSAMASGHYVQAKSYGGATVGAYNNLDDNPNGSIPAATDRIFQLGNGTASTRSNAVTILRNGNTGIGVLAPQQKLEVDGQIKIMGGSPGTGKVLTSDVDGVASWITPTPGITGITLDQAYDFGGAGAGRTISADAGAVKITGTDGLLVTGTYNIGANIEVSGSGTRMFFNPRKAAFRAGYAMSNEWDNANVGQYSIGLGMGASAYGNSSVAMGGRASATADDAVAIGSAASASSGSAIAMGTDASASGSNSIAIGLTALASNRSSIAMGESQNSDGISSTAIGGLRNAATGQQAATLGGLSNLASGNQSTAMGYYSWANGNGSLAVGYQVRAKSFGGVALGAYNDDGDAPSASTAASTDRVFQIGNGTLATRSNAITVLRNGNTGVGVTNPATHKLEVNGSVRQEVYSQTVTVPANGTANFTWTHNWGYRPIIMISLDHTGGAGYMDYCSFSYGHDNDNTVRIYLSNRGGNAASGTVRWIVVY